VVEHYQNPVCTAPSHISPVREPTFPYGLSLSRSEADVFRTSVYPRGPPYFWMVDIFHKFRYRVTYFKDVQQDRVCVFLQSSQYTVRVIYTRRRKNVWDTSNFINTEKCPTPILGILNSQA